MPKTKRKSIRSIRRSYKTKRNSKTRSRTHSRTPSPTSIQDKCCMCGENTKDEEFLRPAKCYGKHLNESHKICMSCWFKPNGFGTEGIDHSCPGCLNKMPLSKKPKYIKQSVPENAMIIDLT